MTVQAAIKGLNSIMRTIPGLRVYDDPPESINQFPACITYYRGSVMEFNAAGGTSFHTLFAEIYVSRQLLPQAVDAAKVWPDTLYQAIKSAGETWDGAISHVVSANGDTGRSSNIEISAGPLRYGGPDQIYYGVQLIVRVKVNET